MKILYLTAYSFPEQTPSSYLGRNRNEAFYAQGWSSVTFTPVPTRGITDEQRNLYATEKRNELLYDGHAVVHRFPLMKEGTNSIGRALRYFLLCVKLFNKGVFNKEAKGADIMFISSTPPIMGATAALVKKCNHKPFVYNLQDIFPDSLVGTGLTHKGSLLWKIGRKIENFTYKHADKIIVISEDFKKNIMAKGVPEEKIEVIYNWVDQNAVVDIPREENKLFDKYGIDRSKFYIEYSGNIGLTQNMELLLEVAKRLESDEVRGERLEVSEDIRFVLVGEGAYKQTVIEKLTALFGEPKKIHEDGALQCGPFYLLPFQPYEDISYVFSLGDAGLVISKPGVGANSVPSKTWSIMSASRPVLANFDPNELKDILNGTHPLSVSGERCGIFTEAGDKVAFTNAILQLYNDRDLCKQYGANGRNFVMANLTREVGTQKYVEVIKSVTALKS